MHGEYDPNAGQGNDNPLFTVREAEIAGLIAEQLGVKPVQVTRQANFADDLGADSLDMVELTMAVEEHFGIEIADDEAEKITTVNEAFEVIRAKLPA